MKRRQVSLGGRRESKPQMGGSGSRNRAAQPLGPTHGRRPLAASPPWIEIRGTRFISPRRRVFSCAVESGAGGAMNFDWQENFTFPEDWGCALTFIGFIVFVIVGAILWQVLVN